MNINLSSHLTADIEGVFKTKSLVYESNVAAVSEFYTSLPCPNSVSAYAATISTVRNLGSQRLNYSCFPRNFIAEPVIQMKLL